MTVDNTGPAVYLKQADRFVDIMRGVASAVALDYSIKSVNSLEEWIRDRFDPPGTQYVPDSLLVDLGSYIGEVIIRTIGGHWNSSGNAEINDVCRIEAVFPIQKVRKRFANGIEDSLDYYIRAIQQIAIEAD